MDYRRMYDYRFRGVDQDSRQAVWAEIAAYLYQRMAAPERVLDPAAGRCEFINAVPAPERWAVDMFDFGEFRDTGVKAVFGDVLDTELPLNHFGGVLVSNLLEHLPSQETVGAVLVRLRDAMEAGGTIAILGPNFRYCAREYFDCADHVLALTHVAVAEHLHTAGFEVTAVVPRFLPYSFRSPLPVSPWLTRMYLHTPILWRLLGKQFLVLGRKPGSAAAS
jgi:hypothetical protein